MQDDEPVTDGGDSHPAYPGGPVAPVSRRGAWRLWLLVLVLVLGAAVLGPWGPRGAWHRGDLSDPGGTPDAATSAPPTPSPSASGTTAPVSTAPTDRPTPSGPDPRLGWGPNPPAGGGPHAFATFQQDGVTPVAYDPCRQVHYVIRPDEAPEGGEAIIQAAVARVSETTGLQFVYDGPTDEVPADDRAVFQPDRYGDRWAPVLVAWQTDVENPSLAGDTVGVGGSTAVSLGDGPRIYVTGSVVLDSTQLPGILERRGGARVAQGIVLHELGHLVGLDHVDDDGQLMYPETVPGVVDFARGDLEGLSILGRGRCVPEL